MKNFRFETLGLPAIFLVLVAATAVGCGTSDSENPVTPEKMVEIRKQEDAQRSNFHPDMSKPPSTGATAGGK